MKPQESLKSTREKIIKGIELAYNKLVEESARNNDVLVFSEGNRIVRVKARDINK